MRMNLLAVVDNPYQGRYRKVLCVCSAGCLRSPTAAVVLSQEPYNFNTRAAGTNEEIAIVPLTETLLYWADEVVCMEEYQAVHITKRLQEIERDIPVINLGIPDNFEYRNPRLIELIKQRYDERSA